MLEIGTSLGYATLNFAQNMPAGSEVWTIDIEDLRCEELKRYCGDVKIFFLKGRSQEILQDLIDKKIYFDLVFIDGDHHYEAVKQDWLLSSQLSSNIVFHDVLQFEGLYRVVQEIRSNEKSWDVIILSYPPITIQDYHTKEVFKSNKVPGFAIVTIVKTLQKKIKSNFDNIPKNKEEIDYFLNEFIKFFYSKHEWNDLNINDLKMIFYLLNNINPDCVIQVGHIGTVATKLFMFYLLNLSKGNLHLWDISNFWQRKQHGFPQFLLKELGDRVLFQKGFDSYHAIKEAMMTNKKIIFWVDEWENKKFYSLILPQILQIISHNHLIVIRNFSPDDGNPRFVRINNSQCTNSNAYEFVYWLKKHIKFFNIFQASPESILGDYVNCGHWIYIIKK